MPRSSREQQTETEAPGQGPALAPVEAAAGEPLAEEGASSQALASVLLTGTPWGIETEHYARESGLPFNVCRDFVILRWLQKGDATPLALLFALGHAPGPAVLKHVAGMLNPDLQQPNGLQTTFRLDVKRATGAKGRRDSPENDVRDLLLYQNVKRLMSDGLSYEAAVANLCETLGWDLSRAPTVRRAYDRPNVTRI